MCLADGSFEAEAWSSKLARKVNASRPLIILVFLTLYNCGIFLDLRFRRAGSCLERYPTTLTKQPLIGDYPE